MAASMERLISPLSDRATACPACAQDAAPASALDVRLPCVCGEHDAALEGLVARASLGDPEGPDHPKRVGLIAAVPR